MSMSTPRPTVAALGFDDRVYRWDGGKWEHIGEANAIYGGPFALLGSHRSNNDISTWVRSNNWIKLGGPGQKFIVTRDSIFGASPGNSAVYRWNNNGLDWQKIGDKTGGLIGGGTNTLFGISSDGGAIWRWSGGVWGKIGGPSFGFAVDGKGDVYGISDSNKKVANKWNGQGWDTISTALNQEGYSNIYAGGLGVFLQAKDKLFGYLGTRDKVVEVGNAGKTCVVTDDAVVRLDESGEVWKKTPTEEWQRLELGGTKFRDIVVSP